MGATQPKPNPKNNQLNFTENETENERTGEMNNAEYPDNPAQSVTSTLSGTSTQAVNNSTNPLDLFKLQQELHQLKDSFARVYDGVDRLSYEYSLIQEAKRMGMPVDSYRRLFELRDEEFLPPYPKPTHWWNTFSAWKEWLKSLPEDKKRTLIITLTRKSVVKIVEGGTLLTLLVAGSHYLWTAQARREQSQYQAWQIINSAIGQTGSGGRIDALQYLVKDGVSLQQLKVPGADLSKISLKNAHLEKAELENAKLIKADLHKVVFKGANLNNADLFEADLREADMGPFFGHWQDTKSGKQIWMELTYLRGATLSGANLEGANLDRVDFEGAWLNEAEDQNFVGQKITKATNLKRADLINANLKGAHFEGANFEGAIFNGSDMNSPADLEDAHFERAKNLTVEQVKAAKNWDKAHYDKEFRMQLGLPPETPGK